jgi:hypothetical protein
MLQEALIFKTDDGDIRFHQLKTWTEFYDALVEPDINKRKTLEIRKNDRDYRVGDYLLLNDYDKNLEKYCGRSCWKKITHIVKGKPFLPEDTVALSIIDESPSIKF